MTRHVKLWREGIDPARAAELSARADYDDVRFGCDRRRDEPVIAVGQYIPKHEPRCHRAVKVRAPDGTETTCKNARAAADMIGCCYDYLRLALQNALATHCDGTARLKKYPGWSAVYCSRRESLAA